MENTEPTPTPTPNETSNTPAVEEGKTMAIISYLWIIGLIIAFVMNNEKKNEFASYHIKQSLGLSLTWLVLSFINVIPILGWLVFIVASFVLLYMWIMGFMNAVNLKEKPVPLLGEKYLEWFKNI